MRYILKDGYIDEISFGATIECKNQTCTEYAGTTPSNYSSLEEWATGEEGKLNAWKIVEGNLVFDNNRYNELKFKWNKEEIENQLVNKKYVDDKLIGISTTSKNTKSLFDKNSTDLFKVIQLTDTSDLTIDKLVINTDTSKNKLDLIINGLNMLPNTLVKGSKKNVSYEVDKDKKISLSGTPSTSTEIDIAGTSTNTTTLLTIKKNINYHLSGLNGITLKMYSFNGTDRTEIYSGTGGTINFTDSDKHITHIALVISSKVNQTIAPMLNLGTSALIYEMYQELKTSIDLPIYTLLTPSAILTPSATLTPKYGGKLVVTFENSKVTIFDYENKELGSIEMPKTFYPNSTIYTHQDTTMILDYVTSSSNGVPYDKVIESINNSSETTTINTDRLDINGIATFTNNKLATSGSATINGDNITTGTIAGATVINGDNITTGTINASLIKSGTLSADRVSGGTISASTIRLKNVSFSPSSSKIAGWTINASEFTSGQSTIKANGEVGFYPQLTNGGLLRLNTGFRLKAPGGIAIYNDTANYGNNNLQSGITLLADSGNLILAQKSYNNLVAIRNYCSPSVRANPAPRCMLLASAENMFFYTQGTIWAEGGGKANSEVMTNAGKSSSRNVKTNIVKFSQDKYDKALNLLDKMKLYSYDYKYNIYDNPHKYGFIIDELEEYDETKDFFEFQEYNATIKDNKIDFSGSMQGEHLKTKIYDSDVLNKYLLTVCKAMFKKIKELEDKI